MNREEIIDKVCTDNGLTRLLIGTRATWLDKDNQYGIEVITGKPEPFKVEGISRSYSMTSDVTEKVMKAIETELRLEKELRLNAGNGDSNSNEREDKTEYTSNMTEYTSNAVLLPEFLTEELIKKWEKIPGKIRLLMFQRTPEQVIKQKPVGKDKNGIMQYVPYVEGNYMLQEANACFIFDWKFHKEGQHLTDKAVCVWGTFRGKLDERIIVERPGEGVEELNSQITQAHAIKNASTDAIKKALSRLGFNSDVYRGEV